MGEGAPAFSIQIFIVFNNNTCIYHFTAMEVNGEKPTFFKDKFKNSNNIFVILTDGY